MPSDKIRLSRALLGVSDKAGLAELAPACVNPVTVSLSPVMSFAQSPAQEGYREGYHEAGPVGGKNRQIGDLGG